LDSLTVGSRTTPSGEIHKEKKMVKTALCSIALAGALVLFAQPAAAQNYKQVPPKPTIQDYGPFTNVQKNTTMDATTNATKPASEKCGNPPAACLFYGGDFLDDPLYPPSLANGLANENTLLVSGSPYGYPYGAAVWVPFTVPEGQTWDVTGLFTNNFSSYGVLDQGTEPIAVAFWSINEGVFAGSAGTVVASGTSPATSTATGRAAFGLTEFTVQVTGLSVTLTAGRYWMSVVPICSNSADPYCDGVFFLSDVEYLNTTPVNAYGPAEPIDSSFFDSPVFGLSFGPTNGSLGACGGIGCDAFSAGVLGKTAK
jgi:hypothetical protein